MKLSGVSVFTAVILLASDKAFGKPLTTIEPCPSATGLPIPAITVSAQYQPVSTCHPTTACIKGKCSTIYPFTTYPYLSTVIPCAWNGTTTQTTTVTKVNQVVRASEHLETLTHITAAPSIHNGNWIDWFRLQPSVTKNVTSYETVSRRAIAPYKAIGPLAIPGWDGSGLCSKCVQHDGSLSQLLAVTECRLETKAGLQYQKCLEWYETWIQQPPTTIPAKGLCSSTGTIPRAGVYTWTFPQVPPSVTVTKPPVTVTVTVNGRPTITIKPNIQIIRGRPWDAYVTKSYDGPTTFNFEIFVTKVFIFNIPLVTSSAGSSRNIPVPTGSGWQPGGDNHHNGWWPLPTGGGSWTSFGGDHVWQDWNPTSVIGSSTSTSRYVTTSTSATSATSGPISGSTTSSRSGSASTSASSSSTGSTTVTISRSSSSSTSTGSPSASSSTNAISSSSTSLSLSSTTSVSAATSATSSITAASTTSTTSIVPSGTGFYLQISGTPVTGLTPRQTVVRYVGFDPNNYAIAVEGLPEAALVFKGSDNTTFFSNNRYLGTATRTRSIVQRFLDFPRGFAVWDIIGIFAHLRNTAGFCFDNGFVFAYTDSDICENPINIIPTSK
ncbi:hypothetical protein RBB50_000979 [Rhinocladiella similis]